MSAIIVALFRVRMCVEVDAVRSVVVVMLGGWFGWVGGGGGVIGVTTTRHGHASTKDLVLISVASTKKKSRRSLGQAQHGSYPCKVHKCNGGAWLLQPLLCCLWE